jgi:hypothetical protein
MRIGVIVVSMLVLTTSSEASKSCMTKTEARQHFPYRSGKKSSAQVA